MLEGGGRVGGSRVNPGWHDGVPAPACGLCQCWCRCHCHGLRRWGGLSHAAVAAAVTAGVEAAVTVDPVLPGPWA